MKLIAESGATKTDWRIIHNPNHIEQLKTSGFNPFVQKSQDLRDELTENLVPHLMEEVTSIHFYGAGCSQPTTIDSVNQALTPLFPNAAIEIQHDMLAAARALCATSAGIACILGTGSNSCLYDGKDIVGQILSGGYILGDEGSGAHLGKMLLNAYIKNELPQSLFEAFQKRYKLSKEEVVLQVYQSSRPNAYMATYARFVFHHRMHPWVAQKIYDVFHLFFEKNVLKYQDYNRLPVHFTGSIAYYYSSILRNVAGDIGVQIGKIIESPIAALTLFHLNETTN